VKQAGWLRSKSKIIFVFMKKQDPQNNVASKKMRGGDSIFSVCNGKKRTVWYDKTTKIRYYRQRKYFTGATYHTKTRINTAMGAT
jgi:hypothetical protein